MSDLADSCQPDPNDAGTSETIGTRVTQGRSGGVQGIPKGFTYFVRDGNRIKIGSSMRPLDRISGLQTGSSRPLKVLAIVSQEIAPEFETHQLFAHLRVRGEWFKAKPDLLDFVSNLPDAESLIDVNNLEESAGAFAALSAKANSQRAPNFFANPIDIKGSLMKMRNAHGATSTVGQCCSNLIEALCGLPTYVRPAWAQDERQTLPWIIQQEVSRLAALTAGAH